MKGLSTMKLSRFLAVLVVAAFAWSPLLCTGGCLVDMTNQSFMLAESAADANSTVQVLGYQYPATAAEVQVVNYLIEGGASQISPEGPNYATGQGLTSSYVAKATTPIAKPSRW